jgi:hypothetical protein
MAEIIPHSGMTLLDAYVAARDAGMHLIEIGGEVKISPIIPPGAREIPLRVKASPVADMRVAA